jgi:hypothetical protein
MPTTCSPLLIDALGLVIFAAVGLCLVLYARRADQALKRVMCDYETFKEKYRDAD